MTAGKLYRGTAMTAGRRLGDLIHGEYIPTLTHATERDIDLLVVEELHASRQFVEWMIRHVDFARPIAAWDVKHSKRRTRSRREIDIFVEIDHQDQTRSALLIENKLDASEQPDQAESYREELDAVASGYARAAMIIICPEAYSARQAAFTARFDAVVSYESIATYLREVEREVGDDLVLRYRFRADVVDQAIHKYRRGYTPIPDRVVVDFNARYVALLAELAPELVPGQSMLKPANPRESTSMIFDQAKSLAGIADSIRPRRFAHELGRGSERRANYVAATFAGWGAALEAIEDQLTADTSESDAFFFAAQPTKTRPNPGLVMAVPTRPVDNQGDFESQRGTIEEGIGKALTLRRWLLANQDKIAGWQALVDADRERG